MTAPVLQFPDFGKPFTITTDASGYCVGGVLSQNDKPIALTSRAFRGSDLKWDTYEKEAYAMVHCVNAFRPYVYGTKFKIVTDHRPLLWFKSADLNTRVQKWRFKLSEYDYEIVHTSGKSNVVADAISRYPPDTTGINIVTRRQRRLQEEEERQANKTSENTLKEVPSEPVQEVEPSTAVISSNNKPMEKKKRGRPPKSKAKPQKKGKRETKKTKGGKDKPSDHNNFPSLDNSDESEPESDSDKEDVERESSSNLQKSGCVITKELLEYRSDHILYFITSKSEPLDNGAISLLEKEKIPKTQEVEVGNISAYRRSEILKNLTDSFTILLTFLKQKGIKTLSIAYKNDIENIPWEDVLSTFCKIFHDSGITLIACKGTLKYVRENERDNIFYELHKSPVGAHRGVSI